MSLFPTAKVLSLYDRYRAGFSESLDPERYYSPAALATIRARPTLVVGSAYPAVCHRRVLWSTFFSRRAPSPTDLALRPRPCSAHVLARFRPFPGTSSELGLDYRQERRDFYAFSTGNVTGCLQAGIRMATAE